MPSDIVHIIPTLFNMGLESDIKQGLGLAFPSLVHHNAPVIERNVAEAGNTVGNALPNLGAPNLTFHHPAPPPISHGPVPGKTLGSATGSPSGSDVNQITPAQRSALASIAAGSSSNIGGISPSYLASQGQLQKRALGMM